MKKVLCIGIFLAILGFAPLVNAELIVSGEDAHGNRLIYDTDLDITWYNPHVSMMNWDQAMAWAEGLRVGGVTGWRLPSALNHDGSYPYDGYGVAGSELGHLYYEELNDPEYGPLTNTDPFVNLRPIVYWSSTVTKKFAGDAFAFDFADGKQGFADKTLSANFSALAVHSGNIGISAINVAIDVKPGSCPNPLNMKNTGILPLAVLGTEDFDIAAIDPATIRLSREGVEGEVAPLRWSYKDVASPFEGALCGCHSPRGDGYMDLSLKFDAQALISVLRLKEVRGSTLLTLTGNLKEEFGGTPIKGQDCIRTLNRR
jgi:hypothetical protein